MLSGYSNKLKVVMKKMPLGRLSPSFRNSGAAILHSHRNQEQKTFFKGATSFVLQAEASMLSHKNDAAIRTHLGIDGKKSNNASKGVRGKTIDVASKSKYEGMLKDSESEGELLDPHEFTKTVLEDCNAMRRPKVSMLTKGSSIARLMGEHPSYQNAFKKTVYGKKNSMLSF